MKKMKKIFAALLTLAMVLGMSMTTFAAGTPKPTDATTAKVTGVETGATVTAYQVVVANYNTNGFTGYSAVKEGTIEDPTKPTAEEIVALAKDTSDLTSVSMTDEDGDGTYEAQLNPGYWMVLVRGTLDVYNPMLVGVYYSESGSDNSMIGGEVSADTDWTLTATDAYAKSSPVTIEKTADDETEDIGDDVTYTVTTTVPDYSAEYDTVKFEVKDTLTGLVLKDGTINVEATGTTTDLTTSDYSISGNTANSTTFTISFASEWIKKNGGAEITITYTATMTGDAVNESSHYNEVELSYTNNPTGTTGSDKDTEKVYTFDIDGTLTGKILKKVQPGVEEGTTQALEGATFTLYRDEDCETAYTNTKHTSGTAVSDKDGKIYFSGLAAGTYYLKETSAPEGFTVNNTVYKIDIVATIEDEELQDWTITVTDTTTDKAVENDFTVSQGTASAGDGETTEILNTKLSELPSTGGIGTTIFTIGGCIIMIAAAGLFFASRRKENK